jgi:hypothetical protein
MSKYSNIFLLSNAEYEEIGNCLRLRKYGSWLAEEAWTREEQGKGIDEEEAFALLQNGGDGQSVLQEYSEEAISLMASLPSPREQFGELITIFFKNRGEVLQGKKWTATDDWSMEDTKMLPKELLDLTEAFMAAEDKGVEEAAEQEEEEAKN